MNIIYPENKFVQKCNLKVGSIYRLYDGFYKDSLFLCAFISEKKFMIAINGPNAFKGIKAECYYDNDWFIEIDHELIIKD